MATKYFKLSSKNTELTYESDRAFREDHEVVEGNNEYLYTSKFLEFAENNTITVTEQFFDTNKTYHKIEISDSNYATLAALLDGVTTSVINIDEITETAYNGAKSGKVFAESTDPNFCMAWSQTGSSQSASPLLPPK